MKSIFEFAYTPYILPLLLASGLLLVTTAGTWRFRAKPLGRAFLRLILAMQIWTLGFVAEISAVGLSGKLFWANLQFFGILLLPLFWWEMTLHFVGQAKVVKKYLTVLSIPIILILIMIWTDGYHHLFRTAPYLDCVSAPFCILVNDYGPVFYANATYNYLLFLFCFLVMINSLIITKPLYRQQLIMLLLSLSLPLATDILYVIGISPIPHFNFTTVTFSIALVFIAIALFRFRLFNIRPLAYDLIIENLNDGILVLDEENRIVDINPSAQRLLGVTSKQVIGKQVEIFVKQWPELVERFLDVSSVQTIVDIEHDGKLYYFDIGMSPITNNAGLQTGRAVTIRDVSEQVKLHQEVERLAITDSLTGLWNRRHFFHLGEQAVAYAIRYNKKLGALMLDLDRFKNVNDTYGHPVGDETLRKFAGFLQNVVRKTDIVARYGGEEFIILLSEVDKAATRETAERIREQTDRYPYQIEDFSIHITVSIGMATIEDIESPTLSKLLKAADAALYKAKSKGRNLVDG